ncbi:MAG: hypothetical protein ACYST9_07060, partial [Planctomycetota bacterium]|jgi:hypothetical protein
MSHSIVPTPLDRDPAEKKGRKNLLANKIIYLAIFYQKRGAFSNIFFVFCVKMGIFMGLVAKS